MFALDEARRQLEMGYRSVTEGGYGIGASTDHMDASHADRIDIPDPELLFRGHFARSGPDLVLTGQDGHRLVVTGYFATEKHPDLVAPNGAHLNGELVDLLAGSPTPGQYAQARSTLPPDAIGKVEKVVGQVTLIDARMPEVMLKPARIHAAPRQRVSSRMPQHVDVYRERQPSSLASPFYHASDTHTAEWLAALIDEHASPLDPVSLLLPLQQLETVHLIALEVMDAISAALEPARDDGPRSVASWARAICSPKQSTATKRRLWFSVWLKSKAISPERSLRENRRRYSPKPSQI